MRTTNLQAGRRLRPAKPASDKRAQQAASAGGRAGGRARLEPGADLWVDRWRQGEVVEAAAGAGGMLRLPPLQRGLQRLPPLSTIVVA